MKRIVLLILTTTMLLTLTASLTGCGGNVSLSAKEGEPANGFLWENNFSEITITGYQGASNDLVIPSKINGKPVTKIKSKAFSGFKALKSVKIPSNCADISGAFQNCTSLKTVEINGVKIIDNAFSGCEAITTVKLKEGIQSMNSAFANCYGLTSVSIPKTVTSMSNAFSNCKALKEIILEKGITNIDGAFISCSELEAISIPDSVISMNQTFMNCEKLKEVNIPQGITDLSGTFNNCSSLAAVKLPDSITNLSSTFSECSSLVNIQFPNNATIYFYNTFENCVALKELTIPDGITVELSIGENNLVSGCSSLEKLYISKNASVKEYSDGYSEEYSEYEIQEGYISLNGLDNLKEITAPLDILPLTSEHENEWSLCTDTTADFYKNLMNQNVSRYWLEDIEIDNKYYERYSNPSEDESYFSHTVTTTEGIKTTEKTYYLAKHSLGSAKVVICNTEISYPCINMDENYKKDTILVNGTEYPVYKDLY